LANSQDQISAVATASADTLVEDLVTGYFSKIPFTVLNASACMDKSPLKG
jgi:hypothetical protein